MRLGRLTPGCPVWKGRCCEEARRPAMEPGGARAQTLAHWAISESGGKQAYILGWIDKGTSHGSIRVGKWEGGSAPRAQARDCARGHMRFDRLVAWSATWWIRAIEPQRRPTLHCRWTSSYMKPSGLRECPCEAQSCGAIPTTCTESGWAHDALRGSPHGSKVVREVPG